MLTCIITTLLTSCIDGDYFDFYGDENECSLIRRKRSKDSEGYAAYPEQFLEAEQFFSAECGACCYKNLTGSSNKEARKAIIKQLYGTVTDENIRTYYYDIMYVPADVQANHVLAALRLLDNRWDGENIINVLNYHIMVTNSGGNILDTKDLAIKGPGHIAKVDNVVDTEDTISDAITYNFFIVDQYSDYNYYPYPREHKDHYYIQKDRFGHLLGTDIECFIWKDKDES